LAYSGSLSNTVPELQQHIHAFNELKKSKKAPLQNILIYDTE
jgi:hypothetical protein